MLSFLESVPECFFLTHNLPPYSAVCELFYSLISKRIRIRKEVFGIKSKDLLSIEDSSLASAIINNNRHVKKNKYLIPDTYLEELREELHFDSVTELLWGTMDEYNSYYKSFFTLLSLDIARKTKADQSPNEIDLFLLDHVPYAIAKALLHISIEFDPDESNGFSQYLLNYDPIQEDAAEYLFWRVGDKLRKSLRKDLESVQSLFKLGKHLEASLEKNFISAITESTKDDDWVEFGENIYDFLIHIINEYRALGWVRTGEALSKREKALHETESRISGHMISNALAYARSTEKVQKSYYINKAHANVASSALIKTIPSKELTALLSGLRKKYSKD